MDTNFIDDLLKNAHQKEVDASKSIQVIKNVDLHYDLGHLMVTDPNELDQHELRTNQNDYFKSLARDNVQLFVGKMWELSTTKIDNIVVASLPEALAKIPRAKPIPKPEAPTKWEAYSKEKGINKRKKEKLVYDDITNQWKPTYGYHSIKSEKNDWCIEVNDNEDSNFDAFEKKKRDKGERVAKNELQRLRNIGRNNKMKLTGANSLPMGNNYDGPLPSDAKKSKQDITRAVNITRTSTASLGKFEKRLKNEKPVKNSGKKNKFESNLDNLGTEKEKNINLVDLLINKKPKLDVKKAVSAFISKEEKSNSENKDFKKSGRGSKKQRPHKEYKGKNFKGSKKAPNKTRK